MPQSVAEMYRDMKKRDDQRVSSRLDGMPFKPGESTPVNLQNAPSAYQAEGYRGRRRR